jgi:predicted RNA-binding protein with PUA-like domain
LSPWFKITTRSGIVEGTTSHARDRHRMSIRYWLMKSEPDTFSLDHLAAMPQRTTMWDGVRNYQARNMLRDDMQRGDLAFFYHSNCAEPGIVGIVEVVRAGYPDPSAFDPESPYFDPKSDPGQPRWYVVDVRLKQRLKRTITLGELKAAPELASMALVRRGNRLSVLPVTATEWEFILDLE